MRDVELDGGPTGHVTLSFTPSHRPPLKQRTTENFRPMPDQSSFRYFCRVLGQTHLAVAQV